MLPVAQSTWLQTTIDLSRLVSATVEHSCSLLLSRCLCCCLGVSFPFLFVLVVAHAHLSCSLSPSLSVVAWAYQSCRAGSTTTNIESQTPTSVAGPRLSAYAPSRRFDSVAEAGVGVGAGAGLGAAAAEAEAAAVDDDATSK